METLGIIGVVYGKLIEKGRKQLQVEQVERKSELIKTNKLTINVVAVVLFVFQFARHIKKSEGQKTPKVELQISIYGVKILDPKTKVRNLYGFFFMLN